MSSDVVDDTSLSSVLRLWPIWLGVFLVAYDVQEERHSCYENDTYAMRILPIKFYDFALCIKRWLLRYFALTLFLSRVLFQEKFTSEIQYNQRKISVCEDVVIISRLLLIH